MPGRFVAPLPAPHPDPRQAGHPPPSAGLPRAFLAAVRRGRAPPIPGGTTPESLHPRPVHPWSGHGTAL